MPYWRDPTGAVLLATLPPQEMSYLTATVHVTEQADGKGVLVAAGHTDASGTTPTTKFSNAG